MKWGLGRVMSFFTVGLLATAAMNVVGLSPAAAISANCPPADQLGNYHDGAHTGYSTAVFGARANIHTAIQHCAAIATAVVLAIVQRG